MTKEERAVTRVIAVVDGASPTVAETAAAVADLLGARVRAVRPPAVPGPGRELEEVLAELAAPEVVLAVMPDGAAMEALTGAVISTWSKPVVVTPATLSTRRPLAVSRVLLPLDGSWEASAAVAPTAAFLADAGVDLVVLHVFDAATVPAFWDQAAHARRSWEPEFLARYCPQPGVRLHLRAGGPGEQVVTVAAQEKVDLIALGWAQRLDHDRAATVRRTLRDARVPVLLMPLEPPDRQH